ncbi:MAG TPA: helix-turn-helix domain-containing protein, partial [Arthrobacter sp.]|nr:helix-turn-helix domain-containing protein [Arthrobacter sp.]
MVLAALTVTRPPRNQIAFPRAKAVRFTTLAALCQALGCRPGDLPR